MDKVRIKQIKSSIDRSKKQKDTLIALGLRGINKIVEKEVTPQIQGMINKIAHLVIVEQA